MIRSSGRTPMTAKTRQARVEEGEEEVSQDSDMAIAVDNATDKEDLEDKFGLKAINDEPGMLQRLEELQ